MIFIWAVPKSGSSMVAGVFYQHGLSIGEHPADRQTRPGDEYTTFENLNVRKWLKLLHAGLQVEETSQALQQHAETTDLWKGGAVSQVEWRTAGVDLKQHQHIYVKRNVFRCASSQAKWRNKPESELPGISEWVRHQYSIMDQQRASTGGVQVSTDAVWMRDYGDLEAAFDYCGLRFDPDITDRWVVARC